MIGGRKSSQAIGPEKAAAAALATVLQLNAALSLQNGDLEVSTVRGGGDAGSRAIGERGNHVRDVLSCSADRAEKDKKRLQLYPWAPK